MSLSIFGGILNARSAASHAAENKSARPQFKRTHQFVRLVKSSALIRITDSPVSFMIFGTNHANVNTTTISARTVPAIRHLRCSGRVFNPENKAATDNKPVNGVIKIQNLPP